MHDPSFSDRLLYGATLPDRLAAERIQGTRPHSDLRGAAGALEDDGRDLARLRRIQARTTREIPVVIIERA
jgi:hypothetical protein